MKLGQLPERLYKYVHPAYRVLLQRRNKRRHVKRSILQQITRKYTVHTLKPRIAPLHCARCGLTTRRLHTIRYHDCTNKKSIYLWRGTGVGASATLNTLGDEEIDQSLLLQGGTNRFRDGMAVMERAARPQAVKMYDIHYDTIDSDKSLNMPKSTGRSVPKLSELVMSYLYSEKEEETENDVSHEAAFESRPVEVVSKLAIGLNRHTNGQLCHPCGRLFGSFADYDAHLAPALVDGLLESKGSANLPMCYRTPPEPMAILLNDRGCVPAEYDFARRRVRVPDAIAIAPPRRVPSCTACGASGYITTAALHDHIFECAKLMQHKRVTQEICNRRSSVKVDKED